MLTNLIKDENGLGTASHTAFNQLVEFYLKYNLLENSTNSWSIYWSTHKHYKGIWGFKNSDMFNEFPNLYYTVSQFYLYSLFVFISGIYSLTFWSILVFSNKTVISYQVIIIIKTSENHYYINIWQLLWWLIPITCKYR